MTDDDTLIDSRAGFVQALQRGFETAFAAPARRIVACDPGFADWPLDDAALLQSLAAWLRLPQRRLLMLSAGFDDFPRRLPRFNRWRADWSHAVEAWVPPPELAADLPAVLVADALVSVQLNDAVHWRGRLSTDAGRAHQWSEQLDALLQRSERGFAVHTLGL